MDEVGRAYGAMAGPYIERFGHTDQVHVDDLDLITRHLAIDTGAVLDVGCGPGQLTAHLHARGVDATGVDLVPAFLAHARAADPLGRYVCGSAHRLPVPSGSVAGLLAWYSLIHVPPAALDGVLAELRRVLAPGAPLVVGFFDGAEVDPFDHKVVTAHRWPADELAGHLRAAGFTEVERQQRPADPEAGHRPHAAIAATAR